MGISDYQRWLDSPAVLVVEGRGEFPMDQLRREHAWPHGTDDAYRILGSGRRTITVVAQMARHVNLKRWASFGWSARFRDDEFGMNQQEESACTAT